MKRSRRKVLIALVVLTTASSAILTKDSAADAGQTIAKTENSFLGKYISDKILVQGEQLEKNRYPSVNKLIRLYYSETAAGDLDGLRNLMDQIEEANVSEILNNPNFVEEYEEINVYTKPGKEMGELVVFVTYKMKIRGIETPVPGMGTFYVSRKQDGKYSLSNGTYDSSVQEEIQKAAEDEEVKRLAENTRKEYEKAQKSDKELDIMLKGMQSTSKE